MKPRTKITLTLDASTVGAGMPAVTQAKLRDRAQQRLNALCTPLWVQAQLAAIRMEDERARRAAFEEETRKQRESRRQQADAAKAAAAKQKASRPEVPAAADLPTPAGSASDAPADTTDETGATGEQTGSSSSSSKKAPVATVAS